MAATTSVRIEVNSVAYEILKRASEASNMKVNSFLNGWIYQNRNNLSANFFPQVNIPASLSEQINNTSLTQVTTPDEINVDDLLEPMEI
jgi:hypothetical protein